MTKLPEPGEPGAIERAFLLLKFLATSGRRGLALTQLAALAALPHSTVHRLLQRLIAERMVMQNASTRRYGLGPLAFELGVAAAPSFDLREPCRPYLQQLAEELGDTIYLTVRSGNDCVCLDRYEGPSPIRVLTLNIGSRRPLGLGAGGMAMLAFMQEDERGRILEYLKTEAPGEGYLSEPDWQREILACRHRGYSLIRNTVTLGVTAVGVPLIDSLGQPVAAISVAAIDARMPQARVEQLAGILQMRAKAVREAVMGIWQSA